MKRKVIDRDALRALYPPIDEDFEQDMRRMLRALPTGEERPMRKKSLTAIVIAAVLIVALAATALAAVFSRAFYEDVADMEYEGGYYETWTLEEKQKLIGLMVENGVIGEDDPLAKLQGGGEDAEAQIDALMVERYGRIDAITLDGMLQKELGDMEDWSHADKAWYSQMLLDSGLIGFDSQVFMMPGEGDITPEEAIRIARDSVTDANGMARGALDEAEVVWDFCVHVSEMDEEAPHYEVVIKGEKGEISNIVYIAGDGRILGEADGYLTPQEEVEKKRAAKEAQAMGAEPFMAAHREGLMPLEAREVQLEASTTTCTSRIVDDWGIEQLSPDPEKAVWVYSATPMQDGGMLITGTAKEHATMFGVDVPRDDVPFATVIEPTGERRFAKLFVDERGGICGSAQQGDGTLLLLLKQSHDGPDEYVQIRMSPTGEVLDEHKLPALSTITGRREEFDLYWLVAAGHGGMLVSSTSGPDNDYCFTQLDEQAQPLFTIVAPQKDEFTPRIAVTETGYLLTGYDKASGMPLMRRYDAQGAQLGEDVMIPELAGMKINGFEVEAEGTILATLSTGFGAKTCTLARIAADGRVMDRWEKETASSIVSCRMPSGERIEARLHNVNDGLTDKHLCIARGEADAALCYPLGADTGYWRLHGIMPVGEDEVMVIVEVNRKEGLGGDQVNITQGVAAVFVTL